MVAALGPQVWEDIFSSHGRGTEAMAVDSLREVEGMLPGMTMGMEKETRMKDDFHVEWYIFGDS